jgi:hypothetical protein
MSTDITQSEVRTASNVSNVSEAGGCCGPSAPAQLTDVAGASKIAGPSLSQDVLSLLRYWLRDRRVIMLIALAAIVGGAALNWGWFVAIGAAPILLAIAPCGIMCALGLCAMGKGKGSPASGTNASSGSDGSLPASQLTNRQHAPEQE